MSVTRTRTTRTQPGTTRLSCDEPDCPSTLDGDDAATCRRVADQLGWGRVGRSDRCPRHTAPK